MSARVAALLAWVLAVCVLSPMTAWAQSAPPSRLWLAAGGAATTSRSDCGNCADDGPYRQLGSVIGNVGTPLNGRAVIGVEVFWKPTTESAGNDTRAVMLLGVGQVRPIRSRGFSLKGGMGMAFVRNWIAGADASRPSSTSRGLALTYAAGWEFRRASRVGLQIVASQHLLALGDIEASGFRAENIVGNFWSVGAAVVIR